MSVKRRPGTDLNHDNWDQEEEPEESGEFQKASQEEIAKRTIKTAKRRGAQTSAIDTESNPATSVFSSFGGFSKDNGKSSSLAFSFLSSSNATNGKLSTKQNTESVSLPTEPVGQVDDKKLITYYGNLKGLNQSMSAWVQMKVLENPFCILTPIFDDYNKHLASIEVLKLVETSTSVDTSSSSSVSTTPSTTVKTDLAKTFTFASLTPASSTNANNSSAFGIENISEVTKASSLPTTATSSAAPTFTFGNLTSTTTATSSTGFSFGGAGTKPFTFGNVAKPIDSSKPTGTNETEDNGDEDQPPKYEFIPVVEKDNFYSKRCKIFVKGEKGYADRGVGMLYLKKVDSSEKIQLLVRADTSLGNILLNILLSEGMPTQRMGKNNVMIICLPTPDAQGPSSVLIRVKNEEEADDLLAEINKNKK